MIGIPLKPLRKILGKDCPFHISKDAIIVTRDLIEYILYQLRIFAIKEFEDLNSNREQQGLQKLKRLNQWAIKRASQKIINGSTIPSMGSQPTMIRSPDGEKMLESKFVIKLDTDTWTTGGTDDTH